MKKSIQFKMITSVLVAVLIVTSIISGIPTPKSSSGLADVQEKDVVNSTPIAESRTNSSIDGPSITQMEVFNPEDSSAQNFIRLHDWNIRCILVVIKSENGLVFINNTEVEQVISWTRQNNLSIYGLIDTLKDTSYCQMFPESTQRGLISNNTSDFVSLADDYYRNYLKGIVSKVSNQLDGIILSNLRYKSEFYDFNNEIINHFISDYGNVNWTTLEKDLYMIANFMPVDLPTSQITNDQSFDNLTQDELNASNDAIDSVGLWNSWRAKIVENYLDDLCYTAKLNNIHCKVCLTIFGTNEVESRIEYGQNLPELYRHINGSVLYSELSTLITGTIVQAEEWDWTDWPYSSAYALAALIGGFITAFGLGGLDYLLVQFFDPVLVGIFSAFVGAIIWSIWVPDMAEIFMDPPGLTPQQQIQATINSWRSGAITQSQASSTIANIVATHGYSLTMAELPYIAYTALYNTFATLHIPRQIVLNFIFFTVTINTFQNFYNIIMSVLNSYFAAVNIVNSYTSTMRSDGPPIVSSWLDSIRTWDYSTSSVSGYASQTTTYPATVNYRINIQNEGTQADQYSLNVNLPAGLSGVPGVGVSWTILSGGTLTADSKIQIEAGATASINIAVTLPSSGLIPDTYQLSVDVSGQEGDETNHPVVAKQVSLTLIVTYPGPPVATISSTNYEITLNPATPVNDYQVKVSLDTTFPYANCTADGGDIRFYTMAGTKIPYWIESWNQGASHSSTIWVKIPAAGTNKFRMTFGDPTLPSESDGNAVFEYFDDFSGTLAKWQVNPQQYSPVTISGGMAHLKTDIIVSGENLNCLMNTFQGFSDAYVLEGQTYGTKYSNGLMAVNGSVTAAVTNGGIFSQTLYPLTTAMNNAWTTADYDRVSSTSSVITIEYGASVSQYLWNSPSSITQSNLPINFMVRGVQYGSGLNFGAQIKSNQAFGLGYAMRARTYTHSDPSLVPGATPATIDVDWVCVRKGQADEPVATLRQITEQFTNGAISQDHVVSVSTLVSPSTAVLSIGLTYPVGTLTLGIVDPAGNIVLSTASNVQYSKTANAENWTIYQPIEGSYTIYVLGIDIPGVTETFSLYMESEALLALNIFASLVEKSKTILDNDIATYQVLIENGGLTAQDITISTEGVDLASVTFEVDGNTFDGTLNLAPGSSATINVVLTPMSDGVDEFNINVSPVNGNSSFHADCSIMACDITPPEVTSIQINWIGIAPDGGIYVDLSMSATDPESGIEDYLISIQVGNNSAMLCQDGTYLVKLPSIGSYLADIRVPNARWRFGSPDPLWTNITSPIILDLPTVVNLFDSTVAASPVSGWWNLNKKMTMLDQIDVLKTMIDAGNYHGAYEKLLHDIKPKLTGLKTDENELPWGNGVFKNPWVIDASLQAIFKNGCNILMMELLKLAQIR